nr:Transcription regulator, crp [uncultured bacterium]
MHVMKLPQSRVIYEAGATVSNLYFPNDGMISLLSMNGDGTTIEVGMVGNEGVVGIPVVLRINTTPYGAMVQLPAEVIKIGGEVIKAEFGIRSSLEELLLCYTHVLLTQISQSVVCNRFHTIEKRLCRWLLVARDRVKTDTLHLTQEIIAHMLGISRTGVTNAAGALQKAGFIRYSRGRIVLLDRKAMEDFSCECYQIIKEEFQRFGDT